MAYAGALRNPAIALGRHIVGSRRQKPMSVRAERRATIALVALFALLVQMLAPALAVAAPAPGEQVICTGHGLQTIKLGETAPAKDTPAHALSLIHI